MEVPIPPLKFVFVLGQVDSIAIIRVTIVVKDMLNKFNQRYTHRALVMESRERGPLVFEILRLIGGFLVTTSKLCK